MATKASWEPDEGPGRLTRRSDLPDAVFAFMKQRKEPLTDAQYVRSAVARFDKVTDVSDADRALAFANLEKATRYYGVKLSETDWHQLGARPRPDRRVAAVDAPARRLMRAQRSASQTRRV